ncbi:MAG: hypothetical protein R6U37_06205, partial [Dehalococcoidia bacterium]
MENKPSKLVPALIGGGVMAVLGSFPIISIGNCLCCMWVLFGGGLAAYLYSKELPPGEMLASGDGALVGLIAGLFGALFTTLLSSLFILIGFRFSPEVLSEFMKSSRDMPPEVRDFIENWTTGGGLGSFMVVVNLF